LGSTNKPRKKQRLGTAAITDRENAEQLKEIKESLNALEGGRVHSVILSFVYHP